MAEPLRIRLRPDWDAALTYESLHEEPENRPVFVGREVLIAPLVAEIIEPNKRGTYLISGYRGTGKTTLLIEALSQAKTRFKDKEIRLFPLVLNVSEISASLGDISADSTNKLSIDPRRLLIALIRTIREGVNRLPNKNDALKELAAAVDFTYQKATAAKFSRAANKQQETTRSRASELTLALEDKSILITLATMSGISAIAVETAAIIGSRMGWFHGVAIALAALCAAVSLTATFKKSRTEKTSDSKQTTLEEDNSLQQLETDLKDILAALKQNKLRTVVVMEELDKIEDETGQELAAVIRYFKNLFTQAPALFFFVTDKGYFDIIASAIKRARRSRSYAVEHTFFTHRIFVGRPSTEESLRFIAAIAADEEDRKAIELVAETLGKPGRISESNQLGLFVRTVLFNAANHLFDLKNELRRFARNEKVNGTNEDASFFLIDEQTLPPEQAAIAVFQDLIVEKSRSFEIKGGRAYANEALADSLFALFNELGSNQMQEIDSFLPITNSKKTDALLLDEQLDLSEVARVREAVQSLVDDLQRGLAIRSGATPNTFNWVDNAARAFRYVRQLQKHEEALIAELQRHASLVNALSHSEPVHPLAAEFEQRVKELRDALEPKTADAAAEDQRLILDRYADALATAFNQIVLALGDYGFKFESVAQGLGGALYLVKPNSGDPRLSPSASRGGVLLAFGETETLPADVWSFIKPTTSSLFPIDRFAMVHVIHGSTMTSNETERRQKLWNDFFAERAQEIPDFQWVVEVLPLVAEKTEAVPLVDEIQRIAASLVQFGAWARIHARPYESIPSVIPPLESALRQWKESSAEVFVIPSDNTQPRWRIFTERDVIEENGDVVLPIYDLSHGMSPYTALASLCMLKGYDQSFGGPERWDRVGQFLVENHRIFPYADWLRFREIAANDLVKLVRSGARLILINASGLPEGFEGLTFVSAPVAPQKDAS